jgi:hypothetical protein
MTPWRLRYLVPGLLAVGSVSVACSMGSATSAAARDGEGGSSSSSSGGFGADGGASPSTGGENGDLAPTDNAVILVHAAGMPAVRFCFENALDQRPQPDQETMPEANVVGVEVGSAVRLPPLKNGKPGKVWVFNESLIRQYVGTGQTCRVLLEAANDAYEMPAIESDYSKGVHLLVLRGCQGKTNLTTRSKEECGQDYDPLATEPGTPDAAKGNLSLLDIELKGAFRKGAALPTQVLHLSQALESARATDELAVTFGDVTTPDAFHASSAKNPVLFADKPTDLGPESPTFPTSDEAIYANVGFRVVLKGATTTVVAQQSLADTQKLSSPRDIPTTYYSAASNYVLLLLGSPAEAQQPDGGDPRKGVHLLAVPVVDPAKFDGGGADAGPAIDGGAGDGGT